MFFNIYLSVYELKLLISVLWWSIYGVWRCEVERKLCASSKNVIWLLYFFIEVSNIVFYYDKIYDSLVIK